MHFNVDCFLSKVYLHLSQFFFTFLTKFQNISVQFLHLNVLLHLTASGFHLLCCMLVVNAFKSQLHKKIFEHRSFITVDISQVAFIFASISLCSTEYHLSEMNSSDIHVLWQII